MGALKLDFILRHNNKAPRILYWHSIDYAKDPTIESETFSIDHFKKQIEYIDKHFEVISLQEFEKRFKSNSFTNKEIVLTFDDGYANNLYVVEPILRKYNMPFTVFISTENIDDGSFFPTAINKLITIGSNLDEISIPSKGLNFRLSSREDRIKTSAHITHLLKTLPLKEVKAMTNDLKNNVDEVELRKLKQKYKTIRPMTWDEVIELSSQPNVTIGSHCMWHTCCHDNHIKKDIKEQIAMSKKIIEQKLNLECKYFAYPNGDFHDFSNKVVRKNYAMGFSTKGKERVSVENNTAIIPRISVPEDFDVFKMIINLYPRYK